jgi:translation initiation factor 5A
MGDVKLTSIGHLKKGSYVVIDEAACVVSETKTSRPGKHGHAKVNLTGVGMIDGKKRNITMPGHDNIPVPMIDKRNAQVLSVAENLANVMDSDSFETFDIEIPEELKGEIEAGLIVVYWQILDDKVLKQIKGEA